MRAPKEGLYTTLYPKAEAIESAALVSVTEGMSVERMDVMLRIGPVYTLAGSLEVGDAGDGPYRVELHEMPSGSSLPVVRSQLQARASPFQFHFRGLKSGQYLLLARSAASPDQIAGSGIVVIQRTDINGWRMELGRGRRVRGRVVPPDLLGADRRPAWAGGVLTLLNTGLADTPAARITVNGAGEFSIDRLAPDRMLVEVAGASPENYVKDFRVAGRSVPEMVLDLRQSEEAFAEVVLAGPAAEISGELVKEDGTRIGGGFVVIRSTDEGVRIQNIVRCNSRGEYQITRLRPGDYDLFGWSQPKGGPLDDPDLLNNNSVRASRVKIEAGAILRKRLVAIH